MESKTWLWRRKLSEKTAIKERALDLERSLEDLNEQLSSARNESDAKDDLIAKQAKVAEEAIAGWEKVEAEAAYFKQELDEALHQKTIAEEKMVNIDAALKDCMQQLHDLREEHQHTINDVASKMSQERERIHVLEDRLEEASMKLAKLSVENSNLCRIIDVKEKIIMDLSVSKSHSEADFAAIVERLDSSEKSNESLKYEVCLLQKELEIRNQEREFNLKSAEAAYKQQLENVKKITRLESECQRLRVMIRKRLPGPAAIAKMRSEVEMLGNGVPEARRQSSSTMEIYMPNDFQKQVERLNAVEEENKFLKENLKKKNSELQFSRTMFARTATKLTQAEKQLKELSKRANCIEQPRRSSAIYDMPLVSLPYGSENDDNVSCSETWASALISELENFRLEALEPTRTDDFVERENEKPGIVCVDDVICLKHKTPDLKPGSPLSSGKELVPFFDNHEEISKLTFEEHPSWLQDILKVIVEKHRSTRFNFNDMLREIRLALCKIDHSLKTSLDSADGGNQLFQLNIEKALSRIIQLTHAIILRGVSNHDCRQQVLALNNQCTEDQLKSSTGHIAHIFLWENSDLSLVLRRFITVCNDVICGKANVEMFVSELASTFGWMFDHCLFMQDVSGMEESIKKQFFCDFEENSPKVADIKRSADDEFMLTKGKFMPSSTIPNGLHRLPKTEQIEAKHRDENRKPNHEIPNVGSGKDEMEEKLKLESAMNDSLVTQLEESEKTICNLQRELVTLKESRGLIEEQIEDQKLASHDLGTKLSTAELELNEARHKLSSLEAELEERNNCCEELEATCLELQLQVQSSVSAQEMPKYDRAQEEKQLRTDREISAATEKLAECQETILNLSKQLKALASPKDAALFDKVISSPPAARTHRKSQLLDQMIAIDNAKFEDLKSPQTKEIICNEPKNTRPAANVDKSDADILQHQKTFQQVSPERSHKLGTADRTNLGSTAGALVVVPKKQKRGISLLRNLLSRKKKDSSKRLVLPSGSINT
ncbi:Filament-like plant protein 7 [Apostasia shenzhenica]|uniref:Filament-like plant protein 7 n=1 Tax=Apostasia shenzhenica TaxID=1088818 RepID=A0A2I0AQS1_9ASPA|nr:Filament-like plant protein 7 [Apostasia shenzhenica]